MNLEEVIVEMTGIISEVEGLEFESSLRPISGIYSDNYLASLIFSKSPQALGMSKSLYRVLLIIL